MENRFSHIFQILEVVRSRPFSICKASDGQSSLFHTELYSDTNFFASLFHIKTTFVIKLGPSEEFSLI